jgi:hypothetical protein
MKDDGRGWFCYFLMKKGKGKKKEGENGLWAI